MNTNAFDSHNPLTPGGVAAHAAGLPDPAAWLHHDVAVVLVIDMVESVRMMQSHEAATVARWSQTVQHVTGTLLPRHRGTLVKSLGDGLMLRFDQVRDAVETSQEIHSYLEQINREAPVDDQIWVRAGINTAEAWSDGMDIYGAGVNLAARLATLAGPGETIATAEVRDGLIVGLDAACEDLGDCYLKHVDEPVRAYRIGPAGPHPMTTPRREYASPVQPVIAVIPFSARGGDVQHFAIGDLIADGVIAQISGSGNLRVVSRLSTAAFRDRLVGIDAVERHLGATYVLNGSYVSVEAKLLVDVQLVDARDNQVAWAERLAGSVADLLQVQSVLVSQIAQAVNKQVFEVESRRVLTQPLPTLESYSLLLGSINRMHRSGRSEFDRTREMLEYLVDRHQRIAAPRTWLAKWYVLRATRGLSQDREHDARVALDMTRRALEADPSDSLAMAVEGFVYCHLLKNLDTARQRCDDAIFANPNQALAWLYKAVIHAFCGEGLPATEAAERALALSPIDPQRYYFESLAATAAVAAHDYPRAQQLAEASLRLNRSHSSTWRMLTVALVQQGKSEEAKAAMTQLLRLEPQLTVASYLSRMPNGELATGKEWARAMASAGLPPGN